MYELVPLEVLEEDSYIKSANGAYRGKAVFEGEAFADEMIADERRWRENIRKGIKEILELRVKLNEHKRFGHKHMVRQCAEEIKKLKEELKETILSRNYDWRG